mmetsp:Transcript_3937/g.8001  ORF Transcript_3937/g.8001 Transcript_3937/m.8001 type:complete len:896 (-) Transcript_3937:158-2845(-)
MAPKKDVPDHYVTLGVVEDADQIDIKKAYRVLVLKWHPDKNPADRTLAEEQIRRINTAYGILSNPAKRERYDLQRDVVNKHRRGVVPTAPKSSAKVPVPKEFMMQPFGHLERFLRVEGKRMHAQARQDIRGSFDEFFSATKLSLWWLPDVNNKCRIRSLGSRTKVDKKSAGAGTAGGLNFSFRIKTGFESEVLLASAAKGKKSENVDFVVKQSPEYQQAVRFETACRRGYYLAFLPPSHVRIVPLLNDEPGRVLDFVLVDFSASLNFKDMEEVLLPVGRANPGKHLPMSQFRDTLEVKTYFETVLHRPLWDVEDFATYFEGHWIDWEFRAEDQTARLRSAEERLSQVLRSAQGMGDVATAVAFADGDLDRISVAGAVQAVRHLSGELDAEGNNGDGLSQSDLTNARRKLLRSLRSSLTAAPKEDLAKVDINQLLGAAEQVPALVGEEPTPDILELRSEVVKVLSQMAVTKVTACKEDDVTSTELQLEDLARLLRQKEMQEQEQALLPVLEPALDGAELLSLHEPLRAASWRGCKRVAEAITAAALAKLAAAEADASVDAMVELIYAGAPAEMIAVAFLERGSAVSLLVFARTILALGTCSSAVEAPSKGGLRAAAEMLAAKAPLEGLPGEILLGLTVVAAKIPALGPAFQAVAEAAVLAADTWDADDFMKLLLSAAKGKGLLAEDVRSAILRKIGAALTPKLADLSASNVVKIVLAVSDQPALDILEAAAKEVTVRMSDFSPQHLLLVTQGLAKGLVRIHPALLKLLEYWPDLLARLGPTSPDFTSSTDKLLPDQLVKLAIATGPWLEALPDHAAKTKRRFVEVLGAQLLDAYREVSDANAALLLPKLDGNGALAGYSGCAALRGKLRHRSRSREREIRIELGQGDHLKKRKKRR